ALGPYARGRLVVRTGNLALPLDVPFDVFASHAVDDGTLLLLRSLPGSPPASFLDLGCGYGALGLPVAARFPRARGLLVDRDLREVVEAQAGRLHLSGLRKVALGRRHAVYALPPGAASLDETEDVYARDETSIEALPGRTLRLSRPQDASEDPEHRTRLALLF